MRGGDQPFHVRVLIRGALKQTAHISHKPNSHQKLAQKIALWSIQYSVLQAGILLRKMGALTPSTHEIITGKI